ncbi:DUF6480 family protein [Cellulomonas edaphi]|uniref:DUF6480 family protein n=1 Tax=Cellulomonas edaphi TaxID=3053468 RepID=A0ABT7S3C1_9CELL|nr:DUF6480 family protein [Cellulomons edaphi]MDM7830115.1 DUF6480 family protein [Cellulomons edaphi]
MSSPDPDPATTPGLEPGGGVPVGHTPPGEASTTEGLSTRQPRARGGGGNGLALVLIGIVLALVVLFGVGYVVGLF